MALISAEKQRRYRERHLGVHGSKERIQLFISVQTKAQLGRLAHHYGHTITKVVEDLVKDADRAILDRLPRSSAPGISRQPPAVCVGAFGKIRKKSRAARDRRGAERLPCNHGHAAIPHVRAPMRPQR